MGNKTGKFNVPEADNVNKDEQVISDTEVKVEQTEPIEANGDHANEAEKSETDQKAKKKNIVSWFKKVSIRKEKKPKAPKENGVKEEAVTPQENGVKEEVANEVLVKENGNGDIHTEPVETKEEKPELNDAEKEVSPELAVEQDKETPIVLNGHGNDIETENNNTDAQPEDQ